MNNMKIVKIKMGYESERRLDYDYITMEEVVEYDRYFEVTIGANTERDCKDIMNSLEWELADEKIQDNFDASVDPEFDKKQNLWIAIVEIHVSGDEITELKEEIRGVYNKWKKKVLSKVKFENLRTKLLPKADMEIKTTYLKEMTKKEIIAFAIRETSKIYNGGFLHTDGIALDMDGESIAEVLTEKGFEVLSYEDTGRSGIVTCKDIRISTSGFISYIALRH